MKSKKTVFLTGATGTMGHAGLVELSKRLDRFNITLLARPSKINKEKLAAYEAMAGILSKIATLNTQKYPVFFMCDFNSNPNEERIISLKKP